MGKTCKTTDAIDKQVTDIETIRAALIEAEQSGEPKSFDAGTFKKKMSEKHGKQNG